MKNLLILIVSLLMTYNISAQTTDVVNGKSKKHLVELGDGLYEVTIECESGSTVQTGYYRNINDNFLRTGVWKMYNEGKLIVKAEFENDRLVWIKSQGVVYTSEEIELHRLRKRVSYLEQNMVVGTN
jgi:hypothetical protein